MKKPTATPKPVPSNPPKAKIARLRQTFFMWSLLCVARFRNRTMTSAPRGRRPSVAYCGSEAHLLGRHFHPYGEQCGNGERECDAGDAGRPSQPIEYLAENGGAHEPTGEIAREIDAARRSAIAGRGAPDEAGRHRLR